MIKKLFFMTLFASQLTLSPSSFAKDGDGGGVVGSGGGGIILDGKIILEDFHGKVTDYSEAQVQLPSLCKKSFDLKSFVRHNKSFHTYVKKLNEDFHLFSDKNLLDIHSFYRKTIVCVVDKLTGFDKSKKHTTIGIGYTYNAPYINQETNIAETMQIIELHEKNYAALQNEESQSLLLIHEMLHHIPEIDSLPNAHHVIKTILQGLFLRLQQQPGDAYADKDNTVGRYFGSLNRLQNGVKAASYGFYPTKNGSFINIREYADSIQLPPETIVSLQVGEEYLPSDFSFLLVPEHFKVTRDSTTTMHLIIDAKERTTAVFENDFDNITLFDSKVSLRFEDAPQVVTLKIKKEALKINLENVTFQRINRVEFSGDENIILNSQFRLRSIYSPSSISFNEARINQSLFHMISPLSVSEGNIQYSVTNAKRLQSVNLFKATVVSQFFYQKALELENQSFSYVNILVNSSDNEVTASILTEILDSKSQKASLDVENSTPDFQTFCLDDFNHCFRIKKEFLEKLCQHPTRSVTRYQVLFSKNDYIHTQNLFETRGGLNCRGLYDR
jgi:hypothetical protein